METRPTDLVAHSPSTRLFVVLGLLWLLLAAAIIIWQFAVPTRITIEWETETEVNTAGFNIYRSQGPELGFQRLNQQLVPSQGGPVAGASYRFVDDSVEAGQTYYYRLEDVELDNSTEMHDVMSYTAPARMRWVVVAAALSVVLGLWLLVKGL